MEFAAGDLPWYDPEATGLSGSTGDSVAASLAVTVSDAEDWKTGSVQQIAADNPFHGYADVPFNPAYLARLNFYALDPDAAELDPSFQFEPQMFALDEFSQLFAESCSFHFGFLADLDNEFHRLRPHGVVGVFNEANADTPWYNLYHYWRDEIRRKYLDTGIVALPVNAVRGNWRIIDVLHELKTLMAPSGNELLPDIKLTAKGVAKGQTTAGFGLLADERYRDSDGNARFYVPWMENISTPLEGEAASALVYSSVNTDVRMEMPGGIFGSNPAYAVRVGNTDMSLPTKTSFVSTLHDEATSMVSHGRYSDYIRNVSTLSDVLGGGCQFEENAIYGTALGATFEPEVNNVNSRYKTLTTLTGINDVPLGNKPFVNDGYLGECAYYTGHSLNLAQLVGIARRIGRALEPEVSEGLLPAFGAITSMDALVNSGTGMSAREVPTLYNLYQSGFSFNENPTRTYTAAHLGPSNIELDVNQLSLEGIQLTTLRGNQLVSARERYWTPTVLGSTAGDLAPIMGSLLSGGQFYFGLFGEHSLTSPAFMGWSGLDRGFISRALGSVRSMYTKVEKPSILPAGVASAETTYASGVGRGALELVVELVLGSLGSRPKFGLGMAGFSDIYARYTTVTESDVLGVDQTYRQVLPVSRRSRAALSGSRANAASATGDLFGDQMDAIENIVGGRGLREIAYEAGNSDALSTDSFAVVTPSQLIPDGWLQRAIPSEIVSPAEATMINTKLVEKSHLPLRSQWGYMRLSSAGYTRAQSLLGMTIPSSGPHPSRPLHNNVVNMTVVPLQLNVAGHGLALIDVNQPITHTENFSGPQGAQFTSISTPTALVASGSNGGYMARGCSFGEPVITAGGNHFDSGMHLTTGVPLAVSYPNATPLQMIASALAAGSSVLTDITWTPDGNGRVYVDVDMVMQIRSTNDFAGMSFGQALSSYDELLSYTTTYRLSVGPEMVNAWDNLCDVTTNGVFSPSIGEPITVSPLMDIINTCELRFIGSAPDTSNNLVLQNVANQLNAQEDDASIADYDIIGMVDGDIVGWKPPVNDGGVLSEQVQYLLHTPEFLTSTAGSWTSAEVELSLSAESLRSNRLMTIPRIGSSAHYGPDLPDLGTFHTDLWAECFDDQTHVGWTGLQTVQTTGGNVLQGNAIYYGLAYGAKPGTFGAMAITSYTQSAPSSPVILNTGLDIPWRQTSFIYPDDPAHKMLYRPWRTYVDSAVAKELRMTFLNLGEDASQANGPLGIEMIGVPKEFRFAELVRAGPEVARTFILEKATSKTRMVNPDNRGILTFSRVSLLDPTSQRHIIPDILREYNTALDMMTAQHSNGMKGKVYTRDFIRELQAGRQIMRQR